MRPLAIILPLAASSLLLLGGCFSLDAASNAARRKSDIDRTDEPVEHVLVSNYGWYLFNCIPLVCGNSSPGAIFPWTIFSDHVNHVLLHERLMRYAKDRKASVKELIATRDERIFLEIPGSGIPVPIPFLLCYQEVQISGVLVKAKDAAKPAKQAREVPE